MGTNIYTQVAIWGPRTGSELNYDDDPRAAVVEARAAALRGVRPRLPGARVARCDITPQTRVEQERARPGYLVTLGISTPAGPQAHADVARLRNWIESEVSVALLELISPVSVEWVRVTAARPSPREP